MLSRPCVLLAACCSLLAGCVTEQTSPAPAPAASTTPAPGLPAAAKVYSIGELREQPRALTRVQPDYPKSLRASRVTGFAVVDFIVDTEGKVVNAFAVRSSNDQLAKAAVEAVRQWTFSPGKIEGRPVSTHLQVPIEFSLSDEAPATPRASKQLNPDEPVYSVSEVDVQPIPRSRIQPIYPFDLRRRGITGEARVAFVVAADGTVANAHASSATHPEFGQAATTAVEGWTFRPARRNGVAVNCRLEVPIVFTLNER